MRLSIRELTILITQKWASKFQAMIEMEHNCPGVGKVKLMVGVKLRTHLKIQYCITAIDIQ